MAHSLYTLIVEIDVRHFNIGRQAFGFHCKPVIVRSDLDALSRHFLDRLVASAMTEHQLESLAAKGTPQ